MAAVRVGKDTPSVACDTSDDTDEATSDVRSPKPEVKESTIVLISLGSVKTSVKTFVNEPSSVAVELSLVAVDESSVAVTSPPGMS